MNDWDYLKNVRDDIIQEFKLNRLYYCDACAMAILEEELDKNCERVKVK